MKKIKILLGALLIIFAFVTCDLSENNGNFTDNFSEKFGNVVARSFTGQIVDINNHPIQNATVKIGSSTVQTDVNGVFIINSADVFEKFAYVTAKKSGYLDGSRSLVPTAGRNNVKIMLLTDTPLQTVQSGVESEVSLPSGTKVNFDGVFTDENGATYTGNVQVSMFHLTSSDENLNNLMPGMLYAENNNGNEVILKTFGMLNVTLRGSAGQKLNIANGYTADITIRIDDSQLASAPITIPLWYFDEVRGYWKQDGVATKVGNNYVGTVSHFSWWNCDAQFPTVRLTTTVVDSNGNPLTNVSVGLLPNGFTYTAYGNTNGSGQVSGLVPANTTMTVSVLDICGNSIYTGTIGPFTSDTILPNIVITSAMATPTVVQGTLLKCDSTNVTNGYVLMQYGATQSIAAVTGGTFSFSTVVCPSDNTFTLQGFDYDNLQTTGTINYTFTSPITNIGVLTACNTITQFISYQVDSNPPVFLLTGLHSGTTPPGGTGAQLYITSTNYFYLSGTTHVPGVYPSTAFQMSSEGIGISSSMPNTLQYNLSSFGAVGQYVDMTVNGTFSNSTGVHTLTVIAHVLRDY
ncbi:peptidase associated/transthyretin-like domain-containing protein [Flavobacterium sangjuense]|uniref:DUF5689 domain-containing protein n=1 Tax=Flavobacterium sangjuense TaxID=2518177 RepID=A0A4P7PV05_9FLAO|nr:hypothetical protein [Flavobacterium sangjuense]QBZ98808.1 hypothetical protein GS03_02319 [Flavobacterium sangjuense]